jgi:hypothetical protein
MKILILSSRILLVPVAHVLTAPLHAQSNAQPPALGLLRLKNATRENDAAPLAANKFAIDDLSATGVAGASKSKRNNVDYLAFDAGKEWSRPLRGNGKDVTFVSFQVYASQTTIIDIAGARLGVTAGPIPGALQLMFDDSSTGALQWKSLNLHVATGTYGGKPLAALPVLTVALDPATSTWHLYSGSRLLADHLPLIAAKGNDRKFTVTAGKDGAWLAGLVLADENPLYQDDNFNGIDDAFEKQQRGVLLPAAASLSEQQLLAKQWRDAQRAKPPPALFVARPLADGR